MLLLLLLLRFKTGSFRLSRATTNLGQDIIVPLGAFTLGGLAF